MGIEFELEGPNAWWIVVGLILAGLILRAVLRLFSRDAVIKRKLRRAKRIPIKDFPDGGVAKIVGRLDYVGRPFNAPLTGRRCAQYLVEVEEKDGSGEWERLTEEEAGQDFFLDDGTGEALIKLQDARIAVTKDRDYSSGTFKDATPRQERFLFSKGEKSTGFLGFNRSLRYKEGVLRRREDVAVYGVGRWKKDDEGGPERLVLAGTSRVPLCVSDDPGVLG